MKKGYYNQKDITIYYNEYKKNEPTIKQKTHTTKTKRTY